MTAATRCRHRVGPDLHLDGWSTCPDCRTPHQVELADEPVQRTNGHHPEPLDEVPPPEEPPLDDDPGEHVSTATAYELEVAHHARLIRVRTEAARRVRGEHTAVPPAPVLLREFLAIPDEAERYRIAGLLPVGARVLLSAAYKAGKSTLVGNLVRSLADGVPFLGEHAIESPAGRVVLLDDELDERMLRRWLRDQGVTRTDRVVVVPLRGRLSSFDITDPVVRAQWAEVLRELHPAVVILDCLRPLLDAIGLDEDKEVGRLLVAFDELMGACGADEAAVIHHMGHTGERARGSSRLLDWPDVLWKIVRKDPDDPTSPRYFTAHGRDVDMPERELGYDPATRHLSIVGGSRKDAAVVDVVPALLDLLPTDRRQAMSGRQIQDALTAAGETQKAARGALKLAVADGLVATAPGASRAVLHWLADNPSASVRRSALPVRQRAESECVSASIGDALTRTDSDDPECVGDALPMCTRCRHQPADVLDRCRSCAYPTETDTEDTA